MRGIGSSLRRTRQRPLVWDAGESAQTRGAVVPSAGARSWNLPEFRRQPRSQWTQGEEESQEVTSDFRSDSACLCLLAYRTGQIYFHSEDNCDASKLSTGVYHWSRSGVVLFAEFSLDLHRMFKLETSKQVQGLELQPRVKPCLGVKQGLEFWANFGNFKPKTCLALSRRLVWH